MIFSNFIRKCLNIKKNLEENEIRSNIMLSSMELEDRIEEYAEFNSHNRVLISIDIAARGLEIQADHVILYNLPRSAGSLISKIGRVGRNGKDGTVTCFFNKSEMEIAKYLKAGNSLDDIFKYYSIRTKKKIKIHSVLDFDSDEIYIIVYLLSNIS